MKISKDSWHYKLIDKNYIVPSNLCPYMRRLAWILFKTICNWTVIIVGGSFVISILAWTLIITPIMVLLHIFFGIDVNDDNLKLGATGLLIDGSSIAAIIGYVGCHKIRDGYLYRKFLASENYISDLEPKPDNVLTAWFKDIHDKTCTQIVFLDNTESVDGQREYY